MPDAGGSKDAPWNDPPKESDEIGLEWHEHERLTSMGRILFHSV
jgi:hypothetical protein